MLNYSPVSTQRPKLIALDLDGTLLSSRETISRRTEKAIHSLKAQGVQLLICTGRPPRSTRPYAEQLHLTEAMIGFNGAVTYSYIEERFIEQHSIPLEQVHDVMDHVERHFPDTMILLESARGWFVNDAFHSYHREQPLNTSSGMPHSIGDLRPHISHDVTNILMRHPEVNAMDLARSINHHPLEVTWSSEHYVEVSAKGINKAFALERYATTLNIQAHEVAAFGNAANDRAMLEWAGTGVAVANASQDIKAIADEITSSNDDDGVAMVLESWL